MALQREIRIAFRPRADGRVRLVNLDPRFEPIEIEIADEIAPGPAGHWGNYARAAIQALSRRSGIRRGFDAVVEGDIPSAAGLSSSSALVVACALASLACNEVELECLDLMESLRARWNATSARTAGGWTRRSASAGARGTRS